MKLPTERNQPVNRVTNSAGSEVRVYATYTDALYSEVLEPLHTDPDAEGGIAIDRVYDVQAIAADVLEWHTEYVERGGKTSEWLPSNGYCYALDTEDTGAFWGVVAKHARDMVVKVGDIVTTYGPGGTELDGIVTSVSTDTFGAVHHRIYVPGMATRVALRDDLTFVSRPVEGVSA